MWLVVLRRIKYFNKSSRRILELINLGSIVKDVVDPYTHVIIKKKNIILIYRKTGGEKNQIVHRFQVGDDHIRDLTCNRNYCPYMFAVALKYNWFSFPKGFVELTPWVSIDPDNKIHKSRWIIRAGAMKYQIKDKFSSHEFFPSELNQLVGDISKDLYASYDKNNSRRRSTVPEKAFQLTMAGDKRLLTLKQFRDIKLSRQARKLACGESTSLIKK